MSAEGHVSRQLRGFQPHLGFKPLAISVDQAYRRYGRAADLGRQQRNVVVGRFRQRIENLIAAKLREALFFGDG